MNTDNHILVLANSNNVQTLTCSWLEAVMHDDCKDHLLFHRWSPFSWQTWGRHGCKWTSSCWLQFGRASLSWLLPRNFIPSKQGLAFLHLQRQFINPSTIESQIWPKEGETDPWSFCEAVVWSLCSSSKADDSSNSRAHWLRSQTEVLSTTILPSWERVDGTSESGASNDSRLSSRFVEWSRLSQALSKANPIENPTCIDIDIPFWHRTSRASSLQKWCPSGAEMLPELSWQNVHLCFTPRDSQSNLLGTKWSLSGRVETTRLKNLQDKVDDYCNVFLDVFALLRFA